VDTNGVILARYTYDPYGNILSMSGPLAAANLYRFTSKEAHPNSGLAYYGYRFYDPSLQRWLNRDPIGLLGGLNLYRLARNCPLQNLDRFGLCGGGDPLADAMEDLDSSGDAGYGPAGAALTQGLVNSAIKGYALAMANIAANFALADVLGALGDALGALGDALGLGGADEATPGYLTAPALTDPVLPDCDINYGPYYHIAHSPEDLSGILQSGSLNLGGGPARGIYASDTPAVKASTVPSGSPLEFAFTTSVQPDNFYNMPTGWVTWSGPGVTTEPYTWAQIPINVTSVNAPSF